MICNPQIGRWRSAGSGLRSSLLGLPSARSTERCQTTRPHSCSAQSNRATAPSPSSLSQTPCGPGARDGGLTHYNSRAAALCGFAPDRSGLVAELHHAIGGTEVAGAIANVLRSGEALDAIEAIITRPDGGRLTCRANVAPLRDAGGTIAGALVVIDLAARRLR